MPVPAVKRDRGKASAGGGTARDNRHFQTRAEEAPGVQRNPAPSRHGPRRSRVESEVNMLSSRALALSGGKCLGITRTESSADETGLWVQGARLQPAYPPRTKRSTGLVFPKARRLAPSRGPCNTLLKSGVQRPCPVVSDEVEAVHGSRGHTTLLHGPSEP